MRDNFYAVIMAGGGGTRLWPLSRRRSPKQLLRLVNGKSLFQISLERLDGLIDEDHIFIVTIKDQINFLHQQAPNIPLENYLIEPMPKGTAAVVGMAASYLQKKTPDAVMAVLTADHVIENISEFRGILNQAADLAESNTLVTIGIKPEFAATGYGYIEIESTNNSTDAHKVKQFVEKPDEITAKKYIHSEKFFWNSGMFVWSVDAILDEIKKQMPDLYQKLQQVKASINKDDEIGNITDIWQSITPETIDYGIMEGAQDVTLIPAMKLGWKDLGSWDSLFTILKPDNRGNIELAKKVVNLDSHNCYVQSTDSEKAIAVIGVEDLIIVDHENTLLICKRGESQKVKRIVNTLKEEKLDKYL